MFDLDVSKNPVLHERAHRVSLESFESLRLPTCREKSVCVATTVVSILIDEWLVLKTDGYQLANPFGSAGRRGP